MVNKLIHAVFTAALTIIASTGADAQALRRTNLPYETYHTPEARNYLAPSLVPLKFDGRFEVWYLMGEPVINCTARWLNNHQLSVNTPGGDTIIAQPGDAEVYNLMLVAQMADPDDNSRPLGRRGGHIAAFCDAGIVAQNGKDGFNVAGSPNWDKFLCQLRSKFNIVETGVVQYDRKEKDDCLAIGGAWYSAQEAKKLAREGLQFKDVRIKSLEVNVGDTIRRYEKLMWRKKSFAYKENKARALDRTYSQRANGGITVFGARIGQFHGKSAYPTAADLKAYDALISEIQGKLRDGGAFAAEWREKDEALVRDQLTHIRAIEPNLLTEDAKLAVYQKMLEDRQSENLENARFDPLDIVPVQDSVSQLWGYQAKSTTNWIIKPEYISADPFDKNGNANVVVSQEQISTEKVSVIHKCRNGKSWKMLFDRFKYRQKGGTINVKNEVVSDIDYREIQQDKNITTVGDCK